MRRLLQHGDRGEAVSSRIVMARLKLMGKRGSGGSRERRDVSVLCAYAPTAGVKAKFGSELQDTLDKVPQDGDAW